VDERQAFLNEHLALSRRHFLLAGSLTLGGASGLLTAAEGKVTPAELQRVLDKIGPYFDKPDAFRDVSRGRPVPHSLPEDKKREIGLTRDTWKTEVITDPDSPATLGKQLTAKDGTALDFKALLKLGEKHAVRFPKIMTCLNLGCPLGMGLWEGVPLREVIWLSKPKENLRRVWYYGYHNDDPKQRFRSSLPVGRILEDPFDLPPVILCYKLNGEWLDNERGGPVRVVVPEAYGFKSIKWITHIVLSNIAVPNDTYADQNNDVDSPLKSFAQTLHAQKEIKKGEAIPVTGFAQVGISGVSKVQVSIHPKDKKWPEDDPYFTTADWKDAEILGPPKSWGGTLPGDAIPKDTRGFDAKTSKPVNWPMRLCKIHWAILLPALGQGDYVLRCRTIDDKGQAQPMPRPFKKSGRCDIEEVAVRVTG